MLEGRVDEVSQINSLLKSHYACLAVIPSDLKSIHSSEPSTSGFSHYEITINKSDT